MRMCIKRCANIQYIHASDVAHMHNMTSCAHECIFVKSVLGTRLCIKLRPGMYMRSDNNSMPMQPLHTSRHLCLCLLPVLCWKIHMVSDTLNKQALAQQHKCTAFYCSAAFDLSDRIEAVPCMAPLQQYKTQVIIAHTYIITEAHMRSGNAGRPNIYRGLLISPDALRISTYSSPPCTYKPKHKIHIQTQ
jgi:hypothetical protein